ncbi:tyrosine-type recombinase/integrase [Limimaricola hongkongensis]|uniref:Phage integrase n=1 Tax=Limimaricola hongkongensis DSM 17492 TaxID=1122180 RepID=A0A017H9M4_9RHOB|nr:site-specific integrase [Limimaricola hongkongensis]EYD70863.1 Phage integrase [Limimaricola hongkongensis DSM 17492]
MPTAPKTVNDACLSWLKTCERNQLERATLKAYRSHANIHIVPKIGDLYLCDLSRSQVRDFMHDLLDAGVSRAQVKKVMISLRSILSEAMEREWMEHNVATDVKLKRQSRVAGDGKVIPTKDEIRLIIDKAPASHRVMLITAIFTGMRISELRGLSWTGVDFDRRVICITQRADEFQQIGAPKSRAGRREIPMAPMVHDALLAWRNEVVEGELSLVFPNSKGNVQSYSNINNRVYRPMMRELGLVDEAGRPRFGFHSLRHAAASLFIEQGWNPKKIQTIIGHASITMTMDTYGHLFESADNDVALFEKMERDLMAA